MSSELKTLRNMGTAPRFYPRDMCVVAKEDLRKEAIRWVKELEEGMDINVTFFMGIKMESEKLNKEETAILIKWIKHFFSIEGTIGDLFADEEKEAKKDFKKFIKQNFSIE